MKIGIISIAYDNFDFDNFYKNIEHYFLPNHQKFFYFFTNKTEYIYEKNVYVYYSKQNLNLFENIYEVISDIRNDKMQLMFFCPLDLKLKSYLLRSDIIPEDDFLFTSIDNNEPMFYNLTALLDYIQDKEDKIIYGSYTENFIDIINYYQNKN